MKRIIVMTLTALTLFGGVALADRDRGRDRDDRRGDRWERRDRHDRHDRHDRRDRGRWTRNHDRRVDRSHWNGGVRVHRTRPTFRNNMFYFSGGHSRAYHRPVIRYRYRDYYRRPAIIVENYDPVPGYVWIAGQWSWNGYEWMWVNGHYDLDANYDDYGDGYYDSYDDDGY
ncbi:MAG: hypothetical protein ACKV2T_34425 [Kofleriaceae bacterium]